MRGCNSQAIYSQGLATQSYPSTRPSTTAPKPGWYPSPGCRTTSSGMASLPVPHLQPSVTVSADSSMCQPYGWPSLTCTVLHAKRLRVMGNRVVSLFKYFTSSVTGWKSILYSLRLWSMSILQKSTSYFWLVFQFLNQAINNSKKKPS